MEAVTDFIFWTPKSLQMVTAAMKLKRRWLLGRKALTNLDSILKSRDIISLTKVHIVEAMIFPYHIQLCMDVRVHAGSYLQPVGCSFLSRD